MRSRLGQYRLAGHNGRPPLSRCLHSDVLGQGGLQRGDAGQRTARRRVCPSVTISKATHSAGSGTATVTRYPAIPESTDPTTIPGTIKTIASVARLVPQRGW